ncbi:DUF418 domain-containing protein [Thalassobacillus sp. CUG 92003]|uniref:DUF418 domain-containing protein n=1 Tax=Thalassobacillus sp. CUG 92003 TaxID=2736641 RepID=UPI0015E6B6DC|nr:DUF418 domain-containing protein [Thalassobacillus sp. CUG 92003]
MKGIGTPLQEAERLSWIDAARGLAIFGIFMVNAPAFSAPYFLYGGEDVFWSSGLNHTIQTLIDIFFQASFYTLFSFLFGFGMQMMKDRLVDKYNTYRSVIFRRLMVLIGFGLVHAFLIWHGDILLSYGVIGLFLFLFFERQPATLLGWAYGVLGFMVVSMTGLLYASRGMGSDYNYSAILAAKEHYGSGSFGDILSQNLNDWLYGTHPLAVIILMMSLLPMFLFGMYVHRKRWLHEPEQHQQTLKKWTVITLLIFIVFKAGPYVFGNPQWVYLLQDNVGGTASALFYMFAITLLFQRESAKRVLLPFTYVGRMSLTNYITQSLVSYGLFYSVGFGLYGHVPPWMCVLIVILVFSLQIMMSRVWLKVYRYGPLEWLWRTLTYGRKQRLRRE